MNIRTARAASLLLVVALAAALLVALTPAAEARSSSTYRVTGRAASTEWTQVDGTPVGSSPFGNVHVGWLSAEETSRGKAVVFGWIADFDCEPGQLPGHGHEIVFEDEEPEPEPGCVHVGARSLEGWDIPFTMDRKLQSATLKGRLVVYGGGHGEGGDVVGRPMADIVWTGTGTTSKGRYTSRWVEGSTTYTESYRATYRNGAMGGTLGPMGFDPDLSSGWLTTYTASSRTRTR